MLRRSPHASCERRASDKALTLLGRDTRARRSRSLREGFSKFFDALRHAASGRIDYDVLTLPRLVFTRDNFFPCRQSQSADVRRSCFHTLAMLLRVRTYHLNFSRAYLRPMRNPDPGVASQLNGIDRIRNHSSTQAKVVLGDRIG